MRRWGGLLGPLLAILAILALLLVARRLDVVEVRGRSMAPGLLPGDRLLATRLTRPPRAGEIVLALDPRDARRELVKRVLRVSGRELTLRGDNEAESTDARTFGAVAVDRVTWRVVARVWPLGRAGLV